MLREESLPRCCLPRRPLKIFEAAPAQHIGPQDLMQAVQEGVNDAAAELDQGWQQGCLSRRELSLAWHESPNLFFCLQHAR